MPRFVARDLEAYLRCGILEHGFLRARCDRCSQEVFVAFSCKGRTCPSCGARRMEDTTEHLICDVLPDVPVRQWVLSLPFEIRPLVAYDAALFSAVTRIFASEVFRSTCASVARTNQGVLKKALEPGAVVALQRFGGTLNLNPHVHLVALDGAYLSVAHPSADEVSTNASLTFLAAPPPTAAEVLEVSSRVARRVARLLQRRRLIDPGDEAVASDRHAEPPGAALALASGRARAMFARNKNGRLVIVHRTPRSGPSRSAEVMGFSAHAEVFARAGELERRRAIVRYCVRPPFADKQVKRIRGGQVAFELRHPRSDGTTHVVLEPLQFLARLCALVPPPRQHQLRYFGVLASASPLRSLVVPKNVALALPPAASAVTDGPVTRAHRATWAALLTRVYDLDALSCPVCPRGRLVVIAAITVEPLAKKLLEHTGLATQYGARACRDPPEHQLELDDTAA